MYYWHNYNFDHGGSNYIYIILFWFEENIYSVQITDEILFLVTFSGSNICKEIGSV